jgi:hypothetical protein
MDIEFERRWRHGLPPFDGATLYSPEGIPLPALRSALQMVVAHLQPLYSQARMFRLSDWHEHDGILLEAKPSSWEEINLMLASEKAFYAFSEGDTYVRSAFFPEERDFYLRVYIPDDWDNPFYAHDDPKLIRYGEWDISCTEVLASRLTIALQQEETRLLTKQPAKEYFDSRYSG